MRIVYAAFLRMGAMVFLALTVELAMAGIGGAVAASAAPTPASLAWAPTNSLGTYDYGTLIAGATKSVTFTLANTGGKATGPLRITLSGSAAFTISRNRCSGRSLGPNKSCTVPVQYAPKSSGQSDSATLTASGKAASASLTLSGQAGLGSNPTGPLTLSPGRFIRTTNGTNSYLYGVSPTSTQTFTVTNSSGGRLQPPGPLVIACNNSPARDGSCSSPPFTLTHDTCTDTSLTNKGGSCTFDLEVTLPNNCPPGTTYQTSIEVVDLVTEFSYINLDARAQCP